METEIRPPPTKRRKQTTYGKSSRITSSWDAASLDAFTANEQASPTQKGKAIAVRDTYPITKSIPKQPALRPAKNPTSQAETWDVPSSEDDNGGFSLTRLKRPNLAAKRKVIESTKTEALAPWEEKSQARSHASKGSRELLIQQEASAAEDFGHSADPVGLGGKAAEGIVRGSKACEPVVNPKPVMSGAAARLQAKKQQMQDTLTVREKSGISTKVPNSRADLGEADRKEQQNPRTKKQKPAQSAHEKNTSSDPLISAPPINRGNSRHERTTAQQPSKHAHKTHTRPMHHRLKSRECSPTKPAISAPARLNEMVMDLAKDMEIDSIFPTDKQSVDDDNKCVERPTSPSSGKQSISGNIAKHGSVTPKQAQLWNQLLPGTTARVTPSSIALQSLTLTESRPTKAVATLRKSQSAIEPKRQRLVDRLRASAAESESESSKESTDDDGEPTRALDQPTSQHGMHHSQSQGQTSVAVPSEPKITYASKSRSYVQEPSLEDSLLFDMPLESPRQAPTTMYRAGRVKPTSKSEFDLEDSDEDRKAGGFRSIHELRAVGGNQRFLDDMGGFLDDISDHRVSARSRRRSALMEIAMKLVDKTFAEKFLRLSYEHKLFSECGNAPDAIADFALLACLVALTSGEVPQHTVQYVQQSGVLKWSAGFLTSNISSRRMARDRSSNMSKSAQESFIAFSGKFASQSIIWGDNNLPSRLTPRILALKVFDRVIGKLRGAGDTAEMIDAETIRIITPQSQSDDEAPKPDELDHRWENSLAVSILESLSSLTQSLTWPGTVIERLSSILIQTHTEQHPSSTTQSQHYLFLLLRLSLNLTNDHARNCRYFCAPNPMPHLLLLISTGFNNLSSPSPSSPNPDLDRDILVLAMATTINIIETSTRSPTRPLTPSPLTPTTTPTLLALTTIFHTAQTHTQTASSVEETTTNVAYGYLAIVLACLCRDPACKALIAAHLLPARNLNALVDAVDEFVRYHQRVDLMSAEAAAAIANPALDDALADVSGAAVWGAFTERLAEILARLKEDAGM